MSADGLVGDDHVAVGGAAPLLRAVGGEEGDVFIGGVAGGVGQKLTQGHDALAAEAGHTQVGFHVLSSFTGHG